MPRYPRSIGDKPRCPALHFPARRRHPIQRSHTKHQRNVASWCRGRIAACASPSKRQGFISRRAGLILADCLRCRSFGVVRARVASGGVGAGAMIGAGGAGPWLAGFKVSLCCRLRGRRVVAGRLRRTDRRSESRAEEFELELGFLAFPVQATPRKRKLKKMRRFCRAVRIFDFECRLGVGGCVYCQRTLPRIQLPGWSWMAMRDYGADSSYPCRRAPFHEQVAQGVPVADMFLRESGRRGAFRVA